MVAAREVRSLVNWLLDQLLLVGVSVLGGCATWGATWLNLEGPLPVTLSDLSSQADCWGSRQCPEGLPPLPHSISEALISALSVADPTQSLPGSPCRPHPRSLAPSERGSARSLRSLVTPPLHQRSLQFPEASVSSLPPRVGGDAP